MTLRQLPVIRTPETPPDTRLADDLQKMEAHEDAAHEKRNWVRLSYDCNNRCTFCLDSNAHDGTMRSDQDVRIQVIEGRKKGATRLILSGGEPTMHPRFLEYVELGRRAGYRWIQTVTNGRMFSYPEFLSAALTNGLSEITFSLHGHTAKIHDALVGTPGAYEQEVLGLKAALATGRVVVNVDIVINKMNVRHLPDMLETFLGWGVREFDLLHVIPFGNAWSDAKDHLFYDLDDPEIIAALRRAFAYSRRPDVHIWLNRFPPPHTEGFEELIQDPYKLNDEVRGRREEYDRYLSLGQKLMCRQKERCHHCYLEGLCDSLDLAIDARKRPEVETLRVAGEGPLPGGLPRARRAVVVAEGLEAARARLEGVVAEEIAVDLASYDGLAEALAAGGLLFGQKLARATAREPRSLEKLLDAPGSFEIGVYLTQETAKALLAMGELPARLVLVQPNYDLVTDARSFDVDFASFFAALGRPVATENIAPCLLPPGERGSGTGRAELDAAMLGDDGRIEMTRYTRRYVQAGFYSRSVRCGSCREAASCQGMHINWVRAHGYDKLQPIAPAPAQAAAVAG